MGSLHDGMAPDTPATGSNSSTDSDHELGLQREWARAEETYGLLRPSRNEDVVYIHRQTTERFAIAPRSWEPIPVGHDVFPEEILADMARWYNDIHDQWREITWWLCRVHPTSSMSAQPILGSSNYVVVLERGYLALGHRPHGLVELVFGENSHVFPTCLPRWLNWPLLLAFLEPITRRGHFGIQRMGFLNGDRLDRRLVRCDAGFFIHVLFFASPSLWSELYQSAPLLADTLHTVDVHPGVERTRRSIVFIAGGYTLILSRRYETVDLHSRLELIGGIQRRFPDLATENIGLVEVHPSMQAMDPIANMERKRYLVAPVEEDYQVDIALEVNLPPYHEIGAISVPPFLRKARLISQTGISLVCGPTGELCICYHNGWELQGAEETNVRDGDFIVCWLDRNSEESARTFVSHMAFRLWRSKRSTSYQEAVEPAPLHTCQIRGSSALPLSIGFSLVVSPGMGF